MRGQRTRRDTPIPDVRDRRVDCSKKYLGQEDKRNRCKEAQRLVEARWSKPGEQARASARQTRLERAKAEKGETDDRLRRRYRNYWFRNRRDVPRWVTERQDAEAEQDEEEAPAEEEEAPAEQEEARIEAAANEVPRLPTREARMRAAREVIRKQARVRNLLRRAIARRKARIRDRQLDEVFANVLDLNGEDLPTGMSPLPFLEEEYALSPLPY